MANENTSLRVHAIVVIFINVLIFASCQKFTNPTDRKVYTKNNEPLMLKWEIDFENKELSFARWGLENAEGVPYVALVTYDKNISAPRVFNFTKIESNPKFGEITFLQTDKSVDLVVSVAIDFVGVSKTLSDRLTIVYVDEAPEFNAVLPTSKSYEENKSNIKNQEFFVIIMGKPLKPMVVWTINGKNIRGIDGVTVKQEVVVPDLTIKETITISQLLPSMNGVLKAEAKYGTEIEQSVTSSSEMQIMFQYSPKVIILTSNITGGVVLIGSYIQVTCAATAIPTVTYQISVQGDIKKTSTNGTYTYNVADYFSSRSVIFRCTAYNDFGNITSNNVQITIRNGTLAAKMVDEEEISWWVYFLVACAIGTVVFLGVAGTMCVIRSRMRSINIKSEAKILKLRSEKSRTDYENKAMRHNGPSHVYDLNERGRPDGTQRDGMSGVENDGFDLFDDFNDN